jgi:ankyrin repeat protein
LWNSARSNDTERFKHLLKGSNEPDFNYKHEGLACIHIAAIHGYKNIIKTLLDYGKNIDIDSITNDG